METRGKILQYIPDIPVDSNTFLCIATDSFTFVGQRAAKESKVKRWYFCCSDDDGNCCSVWPTNDNVAKRIVLENTPESYYGIFGERLPPDIEAELFPDGGYGV